MRSSWRSPSCGLCRIGVSADPGLERSSRLNEDQKLKRPAELFDLSGKVAVVTGGARGIGEALSWGLASAGADVVIASRNLERCEEVATDIARATGRRTYARRLHVGHWDEIAPFAEDVW